MTDVEDTDDVKKAIEEVKKKAALQDKQTVMTVEFAAFKMRSPKDLLECMSALGKGIKGSLTREQFHHLPIHIQKMAKVIEVIEVDE